MEAPGEPVGAYTVQGTLEENTCGRTALPAADALQFGVEIRANGESGHWIVGQELPGFEGDLDEEGNFLFGVEQVNAVIQPGTMTGGVEQPEDYFAADPEQGARRTEGGCAISIIERIEGRISRRFDGDGGVRILDGDASDEGDERDLSADNRIELAPMPGSDCRSTLAVEGGPFLALPCYARYTLTGTLDED